MRPNPPFSAVPEGFRLLHAVTGHQGYVPKHIAQESRANKVTAELGATDGGDAGGRRASPSTVLEQAAALELHIVASSEEALRRAQQLCEAHLKKVHAQMASWARGHASSRRSSRGSAAGSSRRESPASGGPLRPSPASGGRSALTLADFISVKTPTRPPRAERPLL